MDKIATCSYQNKQVSITELLKRTTDRGIAATILEKKVMWGIYLLDITGRISNRMCRMSDVSRFIDSLQNLLHTWEMSGGYLSRTTPGKEP